MTEGRMLGAEEYVEVMHDYSYQREGRTICMLKGEILMLLARTTPDWWQVIRQGEQRPFFAPQQYVRVTTVKHDQMKQFIKQGRQQQKAQQKYSSDDTAPEVRASAPPLQMMENKPLSPTWEIPPPPNPLTSQSYIAKIESGRMMTERRDIYPNRPQALSSFKSDPLKGLPPRSSSNDLPSPLTNSRAFTPVWQESSSSHTSKSSLNDGSSAESLRHLQFRKQVVKAASHDELLCGERSQSVMDVSQPRAASNEELDGHYCARDLMFRSNQLSHRHRSNSVDLRIIQKELSFCEMKQGSLDKSRKPRLSKDPSNRRRSWAVEERRTSDHFRPSLKRGETVDAAIVLDVPPKLPPKQRKHKLDAYNSSSENIGKLEGPIDIKLQEVKMTKSALSSRTSVMGKEVEKGHLRHASDPLVLLDSEKNVSLDHKDVQSVKDIPVALPRKILPPQVSAFENKPEKSEGNKDKNCAPVQPRSLSSFLHKDDNGNQVLKSSSYSNLNNNTVGTMEDGFLKRGGSLSQASHGQKSGASSETVRKSLSTPESLRKASGTPKMSRKDSAAPGSPRSDSGSTGKVSGIREKWQSFKLKGEKKTSGKEEEKENEALKIPPRETPTPDSSRGGKVIQTPPSPQTSPLRLLVDDWGEYMDDTTRRPFYYNARTHEKRWKPPRKGIQSVAIPEVPSDCMQEELRGNPGRGPPRSPVPDYPNSPKSSHKPFSYSNHSEGFLPSKCNRSATLSPSPTHSTHHLEATSHTLPAYSPSPGKSFVARHSPVSKLSIGTPPEVPPSSAKPNFPATPTTPSSPELPEHNKTDQNSALLDVLYNLSPPKGWCKKYDALTQRVYFHNMVTGQRWLATNNDEGKIYYYEESGSKSQWRLPQIDAYDNCSVDGKVDSSQPSSPPESLRISRIAEELQNWSENIVKEGFLHRTFFLRDGKKVRKNWTQSYARYIVAPFNSGSSGLLYFSKTKDDDKKAEIFEFYPPCQLEHSSDKKTSRQQVLGLRNVNETEVLIQFEDKDIADEWFKVLADHDGMQYYMQPVLEKEEKKGKRGSEKLKRVSSTEQLSDSKGITEKLRHFIKRRPAKETLEKKGIYKESVFGGTLAELHVQDKTYIPIFVLQCINHIEKSEENLRTDGLYRISGNAAQIQKIRFEVAQRNYGILSQEKEIHNLSGALKLFFRELKEPLIPFDNYQDFIQATGSEFRKMNQQAEKLTKAVKKLPQENYDTLKLLLQHLLRVSEYESDNRMSLSNLAIVFGPCLLWPRDTSSHDLMTDVMLHNRVIEGLLSDFPKIYSSKR